jgi:hypothetical protein
MAILGIVVIVLVCWIASGWITDDRDYNRLRPPHEPGDNQHGEDNDGD